MLNFKHIEHYRLFLSVIFSGTFTGTSHNHRLNVCIPVIVLCVVEVLVCIATYAI